MAPNFAKKIAPVLFGIGGLVVPVGSDASEENANILQLASGGAKNYLTIQQSPLGGHSAQILVGNVDALSASDVWQRTTTTTLRPGIILQKGSGHVLDLKVGGLGNQLAVDQTGDSHHLAITSQGSRNIISVSQAGHGNRSAVSQTGLRNTVAISQRP